jgi:hypothetical protein
LTITTTDTVGTVRFIGNNDAKLTTTVDTSFGTAAPEVEVLDTAGKLMSGVTVTFALPTSGAGATAAGSLTVTTGTLTSGTLGIAVATVLTANTIAGSWSLKATAGGVSATLTMTNTPGAFAQLVYVSGSGQSATVASAFSAPLIVEAEDQYGNGLVTVPTITFTAPTSGASATLSATSPVSGQTGQVEVHATANKVASTTAYTISASATLPSGTKTTVTPHAFTLTNTPGAPEVKVSSGSGQTVTNADSFAPLVVTVTDEYGNVISGATVTFTVNKSGTSPYLAAFPGSAETATATSNSSGLATAPTLTSRDVASGTFTVTASAPGATMSATFTLMVEIVQ